MTKELEERRQNDTHTHSVSVKVMCVCRFFPCRRASLSYSASTIFFFIRSRQQSTLLGTRFLKFPCTISCLAYSSNTDTVDDDCNVNAESDNAMADKALNDDTGSDTNAATDNDLNNHDVHSDNAVDEALDNDNTDK